MVEITCVGYESTDVQDEARKLADKLSFTLCAESPSCLFLSNERLSLKTPSFNLLSVDFDPRLWNRRKAEGKKQGIVRACKPAAHLRIIDATAGWGRDAAILASFGAQVLMIERNVVMNALLADALKRLTDKDAMNLSLHHGDALSYLKHLDVLDYPDVIYIDPMHPRRMKAALVKKDLQVLQELIGPDEDALELIALARTRVKQRVVVKWPQKLKPLAEASNSIPGKTTRFDIYYP